MNRRDCTGCAVTENGWERRLSLHGTMGTLHADHAGVISRSAEGLARLVKVFVEVVKTFGMTLSAKKTGTTGSLSSSALLFSIQSMRCIISTPREIAKDASRQYLRACIIDTPSLIRHRREQLARRASLALLLRIRPGDRQPTTSGAGAQETVVQREVIETMLYAWVTGLPYRPRTAICSPLTSERFRLFSGRPAA